jgi:hypothetical protein
MSETKRVPFIWMTVERFDNEDRWHAKQHLFIPVERKIPIIGEKYIGNKAACGKAIAVDDENKSMAFDELVKETEIREKMCCKTCAKYETAHAQ